MTTIIIIIGGIILLGIALFVLKKERSENLPAVSEDVNLPATQTNEPSQAQEPTQQSELETLTEENTDNPQQ